MRTTIIDLTGVRGDTLARFIPLLVDGQPMTAEDAQAFAAQFTERRVQIRSRADDAVPLAQADHTNGAVRVETAPVVGIAFEVAAADMQDVESGVWDLELTDPRPGNPLGPLVWTFAAGKIKLRKDVSRD
ncbi:hypothetical protein [Deinococcus sp. NW-56]|uniref:hypothetical protein n=1 Tax=Deinococcus sp. NW-56 TaxID=2080419 RepID=UPI000CF3B6E3|nr:hypothetical protein [Deinococcus sp. NW-56]